MNTSLAFTFAALAVASAFAAEKKITLEKLPPAVQAAVKEQTKNATLAGLSQEAEKGKTVYEVETKVNGKTRDLLFDKTGALIETEEEVDLATVPEAAKAAIARRQGSAALEMVEKLTAGGSVSYEAHVKSKLGKKSEIGVNPDGTPHKD